ncbi:MAG: hypothetical protein AAGA69_02755 [Pseudomonadota bacterium]
MLALTLSTMVKVKDDLGNPAMIRSTLLALSSAVLLAGCASTLEELRTADEQNLGICPNVFALEDAARVVEFNGEPMLENVAWSAEITDVRSSCRYVRDRPIRAAVEVDLAVGRGPAAEGDTYEVEYFVAVTRTNRHVIAKETFTKPVRVRGGIASIDLTEEINSILIPRKDNSISGTNFEIAVGFALTRDQILYNRSGKSLKFPEL